MKTRIDLPGYRTTTQIAEWAGIDRWQARDAVLALEREGAIAVSRRGKQGVLLVSQEDLPLVKEWLIRRGLWRGAT